MFSCNILGFKGLGFRVALWLTADKGIFACLSLLGNPAWQVNMRQSSFKEAARAHHAALDLRHPSSCNHSFTHINKGSENARYKQHAQPS